MKPEIREFIGKHQLFFELMEKEEITADIGKTIGVINFLIGNRFGKLTCLQ